jgi:predicted O-linked N-acetylglucosamine transferase (SPINDLY family)/Tfp pilus assembly protein PilF
MSEQALLEQAKVCLEQGEYETAIAFLEQCIEKEEKIEYYGYLGLAYILQEKYEEAQEIWFSALLTESALNCENSPAELTHILTEAIAWQKQKYQWKIVLNLCQVILELDTNNIPVWLDLVEAYFQLEHHDNLESYQRLLDSIPIDIIIYNHLGNLYQTSGHFEKAKKTYFSAIAIDSDFFESYFNLGKLYASQNNHETALYYYKKALDLDSNNPLIHFQMGFSEEQKSNLIQANFHYAYQHYYELNNSQAAYHFEICLQHPDAPDFLYFYTADCYYKLHQIDQSITIYYRGLAKYPSSELLYQWLIYTLHNTDHLYEAFTEVDNAIQNTNNFFLFQSQKLILLPILYDTQEEVEICRRFYEKNLKNLINTVNCSPENRNFISEDPTQLTNTFYLQYQSKNDTNFQIKYANLIHRLLTDKFQGILPETFFDINKNKDKIRVGYFSNCFRFHTVADLMLGWFKYQDRSKYEIYTYYYDTRNNLIDPMTQTFQSYSDRFTHFNKSDLDIVIQQLLQDQLDILVYLDVGMVPITNFLASIRLAPIQCTTWGHPITSGSPVMDYFLSSDLMEPDNAATHYSETLIRLPNLGIAYSKPSLPEEVLTRQHFNLADDALIYFCSQSLFKYLPKFDYIYPEIAQKVPKAMFVFIVFNANPFVTNKFSQRMQRVFQHYGLDANQYVKLLPRLNSQEFLSMNLIADGFLDSFGWSGGKTTLEALSCLLPVITCPGEFMRGRHAYGILQMLGITETITADETEYIKLAIKLAHDAAWRLSLKEKIQLNLECLFNDVIAVRGLEHFYQQAIQYYPLKVTDFSYS